MTLPSAAIVPLDPKWNGLIAAEWLEKLDRTPFLTRCRNGSVSLFELQAFIVQQFHYARHFTRYLCALMGNLSLEADRSALASNLFEELGLSGGSGVAHAVLYRNMMLDLQLDPNETAPHPATQRLIKAMLTACSNVDPLVGLGALCLGAEAIVPHVYSHVVAGFIKAGVGVEKLSFFKIHIEDDDEHAVTMRRIIDRELLANPGRVGVLKDAARNLIEARTDFFLSIKPAQPYAAQQASLKQWGQG